VHQYLIMKAITKISLSLALIPFTAGKLYSQIQASPIPKLIEKNGRHALLVDGEPFFILGGQAHNSSAWPGMMPQVWEAVKELHANTLEVPIYWEQVEPQPGKFDFTLINTLLQQARAHKVRLVLLWFATWKNGSNHYMPEWMKRDAIKYPNITGAKGQAIDSPSPNVQATLDADIKAFRAVMRYLKQADPMRTVIMVQVENEPGSWDSVRDHSPFVQKMFEGPVPAQLLNRAVLKQLNVDTDRKGSWKEVFGNRADEYFQAWSIARFIGQVAAEGKAEYSLPLYVNAALRDPLTNPMATSYESGGPTDNVIPIWKAAAPAIDLLAPDIYLEGSDKVQKVIELYSRPDNALFVPEAGLVPVNAKYFYDVLAHGGIGFSPFGIDDNGKGSGKTALAARLAPYSREYAMATAMMRELAKWSFEGKIKAVVEHEDHVDQTIDLGEWQAIVSFKPERGDTVKDKTEAYGRIMIIKQAGEGKYLLIGSKCHITFKPAGKNAGKAWQYLRVEEGNFVNGKFNLLRILNGDETDWGGPRFGTIPTVLQTSLIVR
jgi:hypothetical protein